MPSLNCSSTPNSFASPWIGADGWNSNTVEQIGFDQDCQNGVAGYFPWVKDTTRGWSNTFHETGSDQLSSAEAIVEDLGNGIQPVAPFGSITFIGLSANGKALASAGTVNSTNVERGNTPLTKNSSLSGGTYTLSWLHS